MKTVTSDAVRVGDFVIANKYSDNYYEVSNKKNAWWGLVVNVYGNDLLRCIGNHCLSGKEENFPGLKSHCFDILEETKEWNDEIEQIYDDILAIDLCPNKDISSYSKILDWAFQLLMRGYRASVYEMSCPTNQELAKLFYDVLKAAEADCFVYGTIARFVPNSKSFLDQKPTTEELYSCLFSFLENQDYASSAAGEKILRWVWQRVNKNGLYMAFDIEVINMLAGIFSALHQTIFLLGILSGTCRTDDDLFLFAKAAWKLGLKK